MKLITLLLIFLFFLGNCQEKKDDTMDKLLQLILLNQIVNAPSCKTGISVSGGSDPFYSDQWHLNNTGTTSNSVSGEDAKVQSPWSSGNYGQGVTVAVVDDGIETLHEDLCGNVSGTISGYNYRSSSNDPNHYYSSSGHGTSVSGVIAALDSNNLGLRGAAPRAGLVGYNLLETNTIPSTNIADAMTRNKASIFISNNSWGATDNTGKYSDSFASSLWKTAIEDGYTNGRNSKGIVYLWAAGNGANPYYFRNSSLKYDNSNLDGQANFHGVLSICGIGNDGKKAFYSEEGANLWVCGHTQGNTTSAMTTAISTTDPSGDRGSNTSSSSSSNYTNRNYRNDFNGTSSATPLVAGVVALIMKAYPDFTWRDVREVLAKGARKNDSTDSDWTTNTAGYNINHKYGFGAASAEGALSSAASHTQISSPYTSCETASSGDVTINNNATTSTGNLSGSSCSGMVGKIEFVEISFTTNSSNMGKTKVVLKRNGGTQSVLNENHNCENSCDNYSSSSTTLRYGSARHLGEDPNTNWTVEVTNTTGTAFTISTKLKFYGRAN
ncbi:MAG: S8 family serine peptidase [Leptospiraceae bacterium]|nr:S8 family serine peptidase [Leptospiraceae bacterium]